MIPVSETDTKERLSSRKENLYKYRLLYRKVGLKKVTVHSFQRGQSQFYISASPRPQFVPLYLQKYTRNGSRRSKLGASIPTNLGPGSQLPGPRKHRFYPFPVPSFRSLRKNGNNRFRVPGYERGEPPFPVSFFRKIDLPFCRGEERGGKRGKKNDPSLPRSPPIIHRFSRPFLFSRSPPRARGGVATIGRTDARRAERGPTEQQPDWERQSALRLRRVHILLSRSRSATGGTR